MDISTPAGPSHLTPKARSRSVFAVLVAVLALAIPALAQAGVNPTGAANSCLAGRAAGSTLGAKDFAYASTYTACVLGRLRGQTGHTYVKSSRLRADIVSYVRAIRAASSPSTAPGFDFNAEKNKRCRTGGAGGTTEHKGSVAEAYIDSNPPPVLTPKLLATYIAQNLFGKGARNVGTLAGSEFGLAIAHGTNYGNKAPGIIVGVLAVHCDNGFS